MSPFRLRPELIQKLLDEGKARRMVDGTLLVEPGNTLLRIDAIYAYVSVDADGNEGVCAADLPGLGLTPMIAADVARLVSLNPCAEQMAAAGVHIRLIRLSAREVLQDFGSAPA